MILYISTILQNFNYSKYLNEIEVKLNYAKSNKIKEETKNLSIKSSLKCF